MAGYYENKRSLEYLDYNELYVNFYRNAGSVDMAVNGSVTPVEFSLGSPGPSWDLLLFSTALHLADNTSMSALDFGGGGGGGGNALTNGLRFYIKDDQGVEVADFLAGETIKTNADIAAFAGFQTSMIGQNQRGLVAEWRIVNMTGGRPMRLPPGWTANILVQDNLTTMVDHFEATAQGFMIDSNDKVPF